LPRDARPGQTDKDRPGRATIGKLIADGELQRVPPSREHADQLLAQARRDLASAELLRASNPKRAYEILYDAARR
jgi:hypothetical protein